MPNNKNKFIYSLPYLMVVIFILALTMMPSSSRTDTLTYGAFNSLLDSGDIVSVNVSLDYNTADVVGVYTDQNGSERNFTTTIPNSEAVIDDLMPKLEAVQNATFSDANASNIFLDLLTNLLPLILFVVFGYIMLKSINGD